MSIRIHGKITFVDIVDRTGRIQVVLREDILGDGYQYFIENFDRGDIIGVYGSIFKNKERKTEHFSKKFRMLAKYLREFPKEWLG